jgi:transposase
MVLDARTCIGACLTCGSSRKPRGNSPRSRISCGDISARLVQVTPSDSLTRTLPWTARRPPDIGHAARIEAYKTDITWALAQRVLSLRLPAAVPLSSYTYTTRQDPGLYQSALSLTLGGIPRFEEFRFDGSQRRFAGRVHRMGQALTITRTDHCAADLRAAASKSDDAAQVRRLLAIALALDGDPRSEAAERSGMDRQTLRDWVHRYNDGGIDGLKSRSSPGRAPRLTDAQKAELKALVIAGPDPEHDGVVRWRCADLQAVIERRFSVQVHESTVGKWLHQLGLTRLQPRPVHPKKDPAAEQAFKKTSAPC